MSRDTGASGQRAHQSVGDDVGVGRIEESCRSLPAPTFAMQFYSAILYRLQTDKAGDDMHGVTEEWQDASMGAGLTL